MPKCAILTLFFEWSPAGIYAMCAYFKFILIEVVIPRTTIEKFAPGSLISHFLCKSCSKKRKLLQITSHRSMQRMRIYNYFITWHNVWIILLNILEILFLKIFLFSPSLQIYHSIILSFFFFFFCENLRCIWLILFHFFFFFEIKDRNTFFFSSDLYYSNFCIVCYGFFSPLQLEFLSFKINYLNFSFFFNIQNRNSTLS